MSERKEIEASLLLNALPNLGPRRYQSVIGKFGSAFEAVKAGPSNWVGLPVFDTADITDFNFHFDEAVRFAEKEIKTIDREKIHIKLWQSENYPRLLREIGQPPPVLYIQGEDQSLDEPAVALVGSRRCSYYGEKVARMFSRGLAEAGVVTVSGLARGIDSHVHQATLESNGKTWAVIGSGLSHLYPPENKKLSAAISKSGAVISEFPMATTPFPANFPRRNRIIAGLTWITVVVEGGEKSGSLITARLALEEGREVMAVPGPVTSAASAAPHRLLQMGAKLVEKIEDILEEFPAEIKDKLKINILSPTNLSQKIPDAYHRILESLSEIPFPRESLALKLSVSAGELSPVLFEMELKGLVVTLPGGMLVKK